MAEGLASLNPTGIINLGQGIARPGTAESVAYFITLLT